MSKTQNRVSSRVESRWSAGAAVIAVVILAAILPGRITLHPGWIPYILAAGMIGPMTGAVLTADEALWKTVERTATVLFFVIIVVGSIVLLFSLVQAMASRRSDISGIELLTSSIGVWVANVLAFSLLYWQLDRGGPGARAKLIKVLPDWHFPQTDCVNEVPVDWRPTFIDYLFLGYSTATAFSPTEALPLTGRAKLLMMLESTISLITVVIVASRAINILGG